MPIKPENRARYPKDWPDISKAAKERAGWKCQHEVAGVRCGARQYSFGTWYRVGPGLFDFQPAHDINDVPATYSDARQLAAQWYWERQHLGSDRPVVIVLTVAHLNHKPEDCRPDNLAVMCQRHHLAYDHDHHRANAQITRRAKSGALELF